jgi:hypothetical protein
MISATARMAKDSGVLQLSSGVSRVFMSEEIEDFISLKNTH